MKEAQKRKLMLGAGALTIIGLIWYASAGAAQSENQNGTVGGGYSPFIRTITTETTEPSQTGEGTSYSVQFPTVTIPNMPTPTYDSGDDYTTTGTDTTTGTASTKKSQNYIPANIPGNDTGTKYGITTLGPAFWPSERTNDPGAAAYYSSLINSGALDTPQIVPGTASTKKSQNYIPANIPGSDTGTKYGITISSLINSGTEKEHTFTKEEIERGYVGH